MDRLRHSTGDDDDDDDDDGDNDDYHTVSHENIAIIAITAIITKCVMSFQDCHHIIITIIAYRRFVL